MRREVKTVMKKKVLASSGPYGPLLARSGCLGKFVQSVGLMGWVNTRPLVSDTPYGMSRMGHPIQSVTYQGSCIDPTHQSHTLDPTSKVPFSIIQVTNRLY